jgi:hypothetical protein
VLGWIAEAGGILLTLWHARQVREATRRGESLIPAQATSHWLLGLTVVTVPRWASPAVTLNLPRRSDPSLRTARGGLDLDAAAPRRYP